MEELIKELVATIREQTEAIQEQTEALEGLHYQVGELTKYVNGLGVEIHHQPRRMEVSLEEGTLEHLTEELWESVSYAVEVIGKDIEKIRGSSGREKGG